MWRPTNTAFPHPGAAHQARAYCGGGGNLSLQPSAFAACAGQYGSPSISRASNTRSACAVADDVVGLFRVGDEADSGGGNARASPDFFGKGNLIARRNRDFRVRHQAAGTAINQVHPSAFN